MNKVITEAIGTFFWVFVVIGAISQGSPLAAFAIGGTVVAAVYAGAHVSGAHYNPAVSVAAFIRGQLPGADLPAYIGAQLAGASLASLLGAWVFRIGTTHPQAWSGRTLATAIVVELLFTFFLAFVALNVVSAENDGFYGLAVGGVVMVGTLIATMQTGAAFNPAVALGATFAQLSAWANLWAYVVAQLVGGVLAGVVVKALNAADAD
jgi:aquaporin Z